MRHCGAGRLAVSARTHSSGRRIQHARLVSDNEGHSAVLQPAETPCPGDASALRATALAGTSSGSRSKLWRDGRHIRQQPAGRHGSHTLGQRKRLATCVHDVEARQTQIGHRRAHRSRQARCCRPLDLEAVSPAAIDDEQVELGAGVGRPEVALVGPRTRLLYDGLDDEPLPRGADLGMTFQIACERLESRAACGAGRCRARRPWATSPAASPGSRPMAGARGP